MSTPAAPHEITEKRPRGRQRGHRITVQASEQIIRLRGRLQLSGAVLTFRDAAKELTRRAGFRVGVGTVYRFANGEEPAGARLRKLFGLPPRVEVEACACGAVHLKKGRCPNAPRPADLAQFAAAITWLAAHDRPTPAPVRVYGRRGKAVQL